MRKEYRDQLRENDPERYKILRAKSRANYDQNQPGMSRAARKVVRYRQIDSAKGLHCTINARWFVENIDGRFCVYCGETASGCDRLDNSIGHTPENCVPCCFRCNTVRSDFFTVEEMKEIGPFIRSIVLRRNKNDN